MTIKISPFVSRAYYRHEEYTPQEVADYLSETGDDKFIGPEMPALRQSSQERFRELLEKYVLSMNQKLQRDSSNAGYDLARLVFDHSYKKMQLVKATASKRKIWI